MWVPASENKVEYEREKHTPLTSDLYRYAFVYTCTHRYTHTYFIQSQYMQSFLLKCFLPINLLNKICSLLFLNLFFNNKNSKHILILTSSSWANWISCWRHYVLEGNATLRGCLRFRQLSCFPSVFPFIFSPGVSFPFMLPQPLEYNLNSKWDNPLYVFIIVVQGYEV